MRKNAKAFAKRVKKSFVIGCDVLRISAFKIFQHRDTEAQRIIVIGDILDLYMQLYVDTKRRDICEKSFAEFIDVFHWSGVLFEDVGKLLWLDGDRAPHKLRDVVTLEQLTMLVGIGARQFEGFGAATVFIDMGDEGASVVGVVSAAAEHHPFAIARP